ncbi:class I SAM-dependent methyltransferase [Leptothoe sp. PORK10 BA2]|uniref:class I SAM-dependent methyltransferase n=1 Tax=Leptothoe sp. PORK10 BA2 TaxID=3110254 RepID=UPI002B1FCD42|nr:methyltransferase domain-containing protein [Leptothoe sp. PORK10 BA2]MEA5464685.1 methyltransferase domain-containing protein [Leptothoe sp. PORK10 BA2]
MFRSSPVIFLIFKRISSTKKVFSKIAQAKPEKLFIIADGPRNPEEAEDCEKTRSIINRIDWECQVFTRFHERNIGSPYACSEGISWAFEHVERAIILEDDCLPELSFFKFCTFLLEHYQDNSNIMHIGGSNFLPNLPSDINGYYFSKYCPVWGWATWKRAWKKFDINLSNWPEMKKTRLIKKYCKTSLEQNYWHFFFERVYKKKSVHWDYAWQFACWSNQGVSIIPNVNLVSNIGFGDNATHTKNSELYFSNLPKNHINIEKVVPLPKISLNDHADKITFNVRYRGDKQSRLSIIKSKTIIYGKEIIKEAIHIIPGKNKTTFHKNIYNFKIVAKLILSILVRQLRRPKFPDNPDNKVFLHLGCGQVDHPSFINVDLTPFKHVHYIRPISDLSIFKDQSVDLIYASHCLEHFSFHNVEDILKEWFRVLKIGGKLRLSVPDFDLFLNIYNGVDRDIRKVIKILMGGQDYKHNFHYNVFTRESLFSYLSEAGFEDIQEWIPGSSNLCSFNDWSRRSISIDDRKYPISLNLEAAKLALVIDELKES